MARPPVLKFKINRGLSLNLSSDYTCSLQTLAQRYQGRQAAYDRIIEIRDRIQVVDGISYIQVHPTFLYESLWNLVLLILYTIWLYV